MVFVTSSTDFKREKYQTHGGWTYVGVSWLTIFTSHSNWEIQLYWGEFVVRLYRMTPKSTVRWNVISGGTLLHPPPIHNTWKNNKQNPSWNFNCFVSDTFLGFCGLGVVCVCVCVYFHLQKTRDIEILTSGRSLSDLEWRGPVSSRITPHTTRHRCSVLAVPVVRWYSLDSRDTSRITCGVVFVFFFFSSRDLCIGPSYDVEYDTPTHKGRSFSYPQKRGNAINFGIKVVEEENKTFFFRSEGEERMEWMEGGGNLLLFLTSVVRVRVSQSRWSIASSSFYTNVAVIFDSIDIFCSF
jgi:hypothetical protein